MIETLAKAAAGLIAVLIGSLVAGVGIIHVIVVSPLWFLIFSVVSLIGLAVLFWGGRTLFRLLPRPRGLPSIPGNG